MKLTQGQLRSLIESVIKETPTDFVPFSLLKRTWLEKSGGLAPDEVDPEQHQSLIDAVAAELGVEPDVIMDMVLDWGSGSSLGPMHGMSEGIFGDDDEYAKNDEAASYAIQKEELRSILSDLIQEFGKETARDMMEECFSDALSSIPA